MTKKIFSMIISLSLMLSIGFSASAENLEYKNSSSVKVDKFNPNDEVTFIVEVSGEAILSGYGASLFGSRYLNTYDGKIEEELLVMTQEEVLSSIEEETDTAEIGYTYTALFNGFSIKAKYKDLEKIKDIPGVKNVFISEEFVYEPHLSTSVGLSGSLPTQTPGYTGSGQAVAIIDGEFDVDHEFFASSIENEKFSESEISALLSGGELNAQGTIDKIYKNEKIPFAYDYYDKDYDVSSETYVHGTHVAGIVGGQNGKKADGTLFSGVAPEAQLILLKVGNASGGMNADAIMAALEDAVKIGVCAINCSYGIEYASPQAVAPVAQCYDAAYNAGILISASSGNSGRGYEEKTPLTKNIDYSTSGIPSAVSSSFSVASADNSTSGTVSSISSFSSYGVNESLELKPEITAIGGSVYSSVPGNKYKPLSGTSMSAPHITGVAALMNEHFDKTNPEIKGKERVDLIQNLLMSTATPVKNTKSNVLYSPRVQGAGMVNMEKAIKTPVILIGDNGKTKLSLKDSLTDTLTLTFTAKNLTDETVTFDDLSVSVLTDGYTKSSNGEYYVGESRALTITELTAPETITIEGNESAEISLTVKLDSTELSENAKVYENGFFIDGFINLQDSSKTDINVGIPFTGFYGDWTKASVFDRTDYDDGGSLLIDGEGNGGTFIATPIGEYFYKTGYNPKTGEPNKNYISASPNGDGWGDSLHLVMTPMRTISEFSYMITDKYGRTVVETENTPVIVNKFYQTSCEIGGVEVLDDGEYNLTFKAKYNYEKEEPTVHKLSMPFYVDRKTPKIKNIVLIGTELSVQVYENKYMEYINVSYPTTTGTVEELMFVYPEHNQNATYGVTFNLTDLDTEKADEIKIEVLDNAKNIYSNYFYCLKGQIVPEMTSFDYANNKLSTSFNILNKGEAISSCSVILGFYDENEKLIHTKIKENVSVPKGESTLPFDISADLNDAKSCRMYIWEPENTLSPIDIYKKFNISFLIE